MNGKLRKQALLLVLCCALAWAWMPNAQAQRQGPLVVDSVEEYQKKLEALISERLNAVVPSKAYLLRIFVLGKNIEIPLKAGETDELALPGFRRQGAVQVRRTASRFRVDRITVRVVVNEALADQEAEYIQTIVPLLAEFSEERGDELNLRIVPPAEKPPAPEEQVAAEAAKPGEASDFAFRDWILLGGLGGILVLLLIVLLRVFFMPKPQPAPMPAQAAPGPAAQALAQAAAQAQKEEEEALKQRDLEAQLATLKQGVVKGMFARQELGRQLVQAWQGQPAKIGGLIHGLGPTIARQAMLPHLARETYQSLEEAVLTETKPPTTEQMIEVMREANLFLLAQDLANPEQVRPDPFAFLRNLSWGQVGHLIKEEPINIKAIVLSRIDPSDTAQVLESVAKEMQLEIAVQIGNLQSMPLDMAEAVARDLAVKARQLPDARTVDIVGPKTLVDVMGRAPVETSRYLLNAMKAKDTRLSEAVESRFFMFEAIPLVPPEVLPQVVRTLPSDIVVQALQGVDQEIQRAVIMAFPEQARTGLVTTLRAAQFDEETVMESRRKVVAGFQALAEQGKIDLKQISDAWQAKAS